MRSAPEFWSRGGVAASLLAPLGWAYAGAAALRWRFATSWRAPVPVICVGNLVAGGAGKTPVALDLAGRLAARGAAPHCLSRGYGGRLKGPVAVDPKLHDAGTVGDEALLLAAVAPSWVARDRIAAARAAIAAGTGSLILDDGFQNPTLAKTLSLLVVDGGYGFGNGRVQPAGPLREPISAALARADAVVLLGEDRAAVTAQLGIKPLLRGRIVPIPGNAFAGERVIAFAGIGRPKKFFASLEETGAMVVARHAFADHHPYRAAELERLASAATRTGARLVTTAKDAVRLPPAWRSRVAVLEIALAWEDEAALERLLDRLMQGGNG